MKTLALGMTALALTLSLGATVFAADAAKPMEGAKKVSYKEAKEQCLKENPSLTGKDLHKCIKAAKHKTM